MIVDTSAVLAILFDEIDAEIFAKHLVEADSCAMSAGTFIELSIVVDSQLGADGSRQCDALLRDAQITIQPVTADHALIARQAYLDFGKRRHPAALNFGDCFAYALAKASREPLLYKGNDFKQTDILAAI